MADQEEDQGITAYHGSPHDFDRFDTSKIGTGEGAQAYGHGLYFAESEPVADKYREDLSNIDRATGYADAHLNAKKLIERLGGDESYAADVLKDRLSSLDPDTYEHKQINETLNHILSGSYKKDLPRKGHMYEVHIDAHPDHMLDWDKPLSEQSEHVQSKIGSLMHMTSHERNTMPIRTFYEMLGAPQEASQRLSNAGIHGIKYLDAGSRGPTEQPTSNYVVFDDKLVTVKRKYALGGMVEGYASGGAVEDRDYLSFGGVGEGPVSGSTGSAAGNSYGGGSSSSSGTSSSSGYGNDSGMASARAADRASVAGYSADAQQAGKGFVGGGGGGNYADPRNRAYAEQMAKSARQSYLDANYPESPRLGDLAQPNPAATFKQPNRPSTPTPPSAYGQAAPQPSFPHTPTPFSGYPRDVQNALNPTRPDSSFGGTALDPTGAQTTDVLKNLGTATDAVTMLNAPGFWGGVTRFVAGTPSQPTPQQETQMAKIFSPDMPIARIGDPSLGARAGSVGSMPSGTTSYGSDLTPSGSSVSRPVTPTPSTAYGGMSSQDSANRGLGSFAGSLGSQGPAQQNAAPRQDFNSAFAAARSGGNKTFNWTNPRTGKTGTYGTQLARKQGGRVPSMSEPDEWLVEKNEPENKPVKKANKQVSKPERNPIVSRALMVSSKKS